MIFFDYIKLDLDIRKKQFKNGLSEKAVCEEMGISRSTIWRMAEGKKIDMDTFCKMATWTERPIGRYFSKTAGDA
nr:helix-turn-helix transcriptional regulator [uncultured Allomuricauda sp.]